MKRRKFLLGSSSVLATGGFLTGTGAYSSAEVERNVQIEIVGDKNAYLGLQEEDEDDMPDDAVLFGSDTARTAPESFDVINRTPHDVSITITLTNLKFEDHERDDDEGNKRFDTTVGSGDRIDDITLEIPDDAISSVEGTIHFDVTDVDETALRISAERTLELEPAKIEVNPTISNFNNISKKMEIEIDSGVDVTNLDVYVEGTEVPFSPTGNSGKIKSDDNINEFVTFDCESSDSVDVSVEVDGTSEDGIDISGSKTVSDVNCSG